MYNFFGEPVKPEVLNRFVYISFGHDMHTKQRDITINRSASNLNAQRTYTKASQYSYDRLARIINTKRFFFSALPFSSSFSWIPSDD